MHPKNLLLTAVTAVLFFVSVVRFCAAEMELIDNMYVVGGYTESWEIQPCWSPVDQNTIAYISRDGYWGKWEVGLISMPEGAKNKLTQEANYQFMDPAWSPDGKKIICSAKKDEKAQWSIVVVDLKKNGEIINLNSGTKAEEKAANPLQGDYSPCYSPDGKNIIFITCDKDGNRDIWTASADGANRKKLTANPSVKDTPKWSPDGKKILFMQDWDIWIIDADGLNAVQLTTDSKFNENPAWSPDGKMIAYSSCAGGNADIWVMNADGKNKTQLTLSQETEDYPTWSPDGKKIAFQTGRINGRIWAMELK